MKAPLWPLWIAHRGAGKLAPENTLAAFRHGASFGYAAFECDVKLSADGVPFLLHDATLDRTTNAQGVAGERSWPELSRLDAGAWHSRTYAGEPLPTLDAIAAFCLANGHALNIEIKPTPGAERRTGEVVARAAQRLWAGRTTPPLLSSFEPAALEGARDAAPQLPRALLIDTLVEGWFERAQALGCVAVVANWRLYDRALVERLHGADLWALCYTVNDASAARSLLEWGLHGLITDAVDRFAPHAGRVVVP
jgi:glycerophosphoryl diester phosphodiesterase